MSSNRISTGMMFSQSVNNMLGKQAKISHLEQQLATGQRLVTAADDPVASGTAVNLDRAVAELERFGQNANNVQNRLGLQENALSQAGDLMARVNELTVEANSSALTTDDRKAIASELKSLHASLLSLSNSTDGSGRYLFA
ncbi:flagellar hook protein FlgL, partial [Xanthomonas hyacinthi DSM 19077]